MGDLHEALYYKTDETDEVRCLLCPHVCEIYPSRFGKCGVRSNKSGKLFSLNYARVSSISMDPIEKKPLYHYYPGEQILSIGTIGCNFKCPFCQNWSISQGGATTRGMTVESIVNLAVDNGSFGIAYTYNEPFIWYEFVLETAKLARERGLKNVLVTNGYINHDPLKEMLPYIDAMNIDLKSFDDDFYRTICGGRLDPVLNTITESFHAGCHIELTNLIITDLNDNMDMIENMVGWVSELSRDIPFHFSRYFPNYHLENQATDINKIHNARKIALNHLNYVYTGNITDDESSSTYCPNCKSAVVSRAGYHIDLSGFENGKCSKCGHQIAIIH